MGKKSTPSPPPPPDPAATAAAQGAINKETAETQASLNRINEYNPYGSVVYERVPQSDDQLLSTQNTPVAPNRDDFYVAGGQNQRYHQGGGFNLGSSNVGSNTNTGGFDQSGWDAANAAYQSELNRPQQGSGLPPATYQRTITLNPEEQAALDRQREQDRQIDELATGQIGRIGESIRDPLNFDSAQQVTALDDGRNQRYEDALMSSYRRQLDPMFEQRQREFDTNLSNQGITLGSDAYNEASGNFSRGQNDAYNDAINRAILGAGAEQSRLFGLQTSGRQQDINEILARRNQPINEFSALSGLSSGVNTPQFAQPSQVGVAAPDLAGLTNQAYQGQLNNYNQQLQSSNSSRGGLFGILGSAAGAMPWGSWLSDSRLKADIRKLGQYDNGINKYEWTWNDRAKALGITDNPTIGVIAQEVEIDYPETVTYNEDGYRQVNYEALGIDYG